MLRPPFRSPRLATDIQAMKSDCLSHKRIASELKTINAMLKIYCQAHHERTADSPLCPDCFQLQQYARKRLLNCPYQQHKPTCGNCPIHCYKKNMRQKVQEVMRFSGPRMAYRHPIMALRHLLDGRRTPPSLKEIKRSRS